MAIRIGRSENLVPRFLWIDSQGRITAGRKFTVDTPESVIMLKWMVPADPLHKNNVNPYGWIPATDDIVLAQWSALKSQIDIMPNLGPSSPMVQTLTTMRLSQESVDALVNGDAYDAEATLQKRLDNWNNLPADAQMAGIRWVFENGERDAPDFYMALSQHDYAMANLYSQWDGERAGTKMVLSQLFRNATDTWGRGIDRSVLFWPGFVPPQVNAQTKLDDKIPSLWDHALQGTYTSFGDDPPAVPAPSETNNQGTFPNDPNNQPSIPKAQSTTVLDSGGFDPFGTQATQQAIREAVAEAAAVAHAIPLELSRANTTLEDTKETIKNATTDTSSQIQTGLIVGGSLFLAKVLWDLFTDSRKRA